MALGAFTVGAAANTLRGKPMAPVFAARVAIVGDGSYPTGGSTGLDALLAAALGHNPSVVGIIPGDCGLFLPSYSPANGGTLKVRNLTDGTEVSNGTNLSATTFNVIVLYK